jgi:uncharacterized membrane protein (DUF4010 family)
MRETGAMDPDALLHRLGVALAIGLLVGAERHWRERDAESGHRTAGLRTFGILGLLGGVAGALGPAAGGTGEAILIGAALLAALAALLPFALREAAAEGNFSATTMVAALATVALGALAARGELAAAGAASVALTALLASREKLHGLMARITWAEMRSAILLLSMTLVALPVVPDTPIAALGGVNPAEIWKLAILLAAISFAGYLAVRVVGAERGLLLAGAAGGLVSSTAVTLANARAARAGGPVMALAAGTLVAGAVSCLRTAALALVVAPQLGAILAPALAAAALAMAVPAVAAARRTGRTASTLAPTNPFELGQVVQMALLLAGIEVVARHASAWLGDAALLAVAAVSGLADVDAVTLSVGRMVPDAAAPELAAAAIGVAVASNILAKSAYALALGGTAHGLRVVLASLAALVLGGPLLLLR